MNQETDNAINHELEYIDNEIERLGRVPHALFKAVTDMIRLTCMVHKDPEGYDRIRELAQTDAMNFMHENMAMCVGDAPEFVRQLVLYSRDRAEHHLGVKK